MANLRRAGASEPIGHGAAPDTLYVVMVAAYLREKFRCVKRKVQ